ncbi:probable LRR receptor-like serine/threonine-protein kinase At3g47570 [Quercus lobata]|uniref:probable LRR receptor-like serine/threonine-protein kinase At3g47570 n=1 Tax=Quercus lobata TaxID=97700 RepID=UPI00124451F5|nr:probable LRR receptor-like serine/threonine-protein kinase At3g47570 [Quercus lobata]
MAVRTNITTDQSALLALKDHITDDPYKTLASNWSSSTFVCNWIGITCGAKHHRVTALNLSHMGLLGTIAPQVGKLTFLSHLSFRNNNFHGSLPNELASLRRLEVVSFGLNNFSGMLPSWLGFLPKLQVLYAYTNSFEGNIPESLGNISSLKVLHLSDNNLSGEIPLEIGALQNLTQATLANNSLVDHIPDAIFNSSKIEVISLYMNQLSGHLPPSIGNWLPNLKVLYLWGNELEGIIPSSISNASTLVELELGANNFSGSIPNTLGNLRHLERLNLVNNYLTSNSSNLELSFLSSLTNCVNLTSIVVAENPLNGTLPISIGNFSTSLEEFVAFNCNIKGIIPREIGNLSNLMTLDLKNNELVGPIPFTVGGMRNLQGLYLQHNRLQRSIPNGICQLRNLDELFLNHNKLFGPIPTCWGSLSKLQKLYLNSNKLTSIPPSFWSLTDILQINLSSNSLSGYLPLDVGKLEHVTQMDLSWNKLSGDIHAIRGLCSLVSLSLAHNKFRGPIPQSFGMLISMEHLDLSDNNFSAEIPKSLMKLKCLKYFNVSFNRLQGEIPFGGAIAQFSASSFMGNQALCGPPQLKVPPCETSNAGQSTTAVILRYILPAMIATILALFLIFALLRCQKRDAKHNGQGDLLTLATWRRITYLELEQATGGFSESNLVGKGSFGSVYRGMLSDGTSIAVKVFNLNIEGGFKSFKAECDVLCSIHHRNLVKIISSCSRIDFKALVLEYMPKGSLKKWLYSHNHFLDMIERLNTMIDVASSLEYLHHGCPLPVVHCDLKPSNILLNKDMVAHVSDFGISKFLGNEESITQTMTLATIGYMAPEYGSQGTISTRGDVYSYDILLMETFTRKSPTDEMFTEEMSLKDWVKQSIPLSVIEVIDANLLKRGEENFNAKLDCMLSVMQLAMDCSTEIPEERSNMKNVVTILKNITLKFLKDVGED